MSIYLNKIQEIFSGPRDLQVADLESLMLNIRLVLETEDLKEKYKTLNLYCNWCMHAKIRDSLVAYRVLEHITSAIIKYNRDPDNSKWYSDAVIEGLKFHDLQYEIEDFIYRFNLGIGLFHDPVFWNSFGKALVNNLVGRPLELNISSKNPKMIKVIDSIKEIANTANQPQFAVFSLEFIYMQDKQFFKVLSGTRENPMTMMGPMIIISFDEYIANNRQT